MRVSVFFTSRFPARFTPPMRLIVRSYNSVILDGKSNSSDPLKIRVEVAPALIPSNSAPVMVPPKVKVWAPTLKSAVPFVILKALVTSAFAPRVIVAAFWMYPKVTSTSVSVTNVPEYTSAPYKVMSVFMIKVPVVSSILSVPKVAPAGSNTKSPEVFPLKNSWANSSPEKTPFVRV